MTLHRYPILLTGLLLLAVTAAAPAQKADYETTEIDDGVYQFRWHAHNAFFVVTGDGVVAFDPLNIDAAAQYAREIRKVAPNAELAAIVYSHHHSDHATGAPILQKELGGRAPIIAHDKAYTKIVEADDPHLPPPQITVSDRLTLRYGDIPIELHYLGKSHSDNLIVALLPEQSIAFAVDFVSKDRVGYRQLPGFYFPEQFTAIQRLLELDFERIVFGHGPPGDRDAVRRQLAYYRDLRDAVADALDRGLSEDQAVQEIELPAYSDWGGYEEWFSMNVRAMYRALSSAEAAPS